MLSAVISITALLLSVALMQVGTGLFSVFLPLRMELESFPQLLIGLTGSAYFAGFILGAATGDRLIARVGHIRCFTALVAGQVMIALAMLLYVGPEFWVLCRIATGYFASTVFMVAESWLNERVDNARRGSVFAIYMVANYSAIAAGQFMLPLAGTADYRHFVFAALLFAAAVIPVALTKAAAPAPYHGIRFGMKRLYLLSPLGFVACFAIGLVQGAFYGMGSVFITGLGFDTAAVSRFMGLVVLAGLFAQWPIGKLSDLFDRRLVLVVVAWLTAGFALLIAFDPAVPFTTLLVLGSIYGALALTIYPVAVAYVCDYARKEELVPVTAGLILTFGAGAALGPVAVSLVMDVLGPRGFFVFIGCVALALAAFGVFRMFRRAAPANEDQGRFVVVPRTSPVVADLHPHGEPPDPDLLEEPDGGT